MSRKVESLIATLVLLREKLLAVLVQIFRDRQIANNLTWIWLLRRGALVRCRPRSLRCLNHVRDLVILIVELLEHFLPRKIEP